MLFFVASTLVEKRAAEVK